MFTSVIFILILIVWDWDGGRSYAEYDVFRVDGPDDNYRLHVRGYHGNAGACKHSKLLVPAYVGSTFYKQLEICTRY